MLISLLEPKILFIQLTHSGVVSFTGNDSAIARFTDRERGKGQQDYYYENLAAYQRGLAWLSCPCCVDCASAKADAMNVSTR